MKRTLALLAFVAFTLICDAGDQRFYGAWWETFLAQRGVAKDAGELNVTLTAVGNVAGIGTVDIRAIEYGTNVYHWSGQWQETRNPNIISFNIPTITGIETSWMGTLNVVSGQIKGTFKNRIARGSFQGKRQE